MSRLADRLSKMSPIKLALAANEARARTEIVNAEPLAIIGAGCRFPGNADNPESFWRLLSEGKDAIIEVPAERWDVDAYYDPAPHTPGKMISRRGGFVDNLREFDADFFGISPREAVSLDPQQRTLLEVTWETLENAGVPPDILAGSNTGVFVGISGIDYFMHMQACNREIDAYLGTGNALSVASGRLSYFFGLQGPSVSVDTACSSSLVAVHMACQSLRNRDCDLALAGGTSRIILPYGSIALSQTRLLAPDGRCKTFDSSADGYVRGEGCGMILLKRLSDAIADGDNIAALIRGSAINQDGKTSGLTVPNGPAQQEVIRRALRNAAVDVDQVGYLEAHGTGTSLGDPIEVTALATVFDQRRLRPEPLLIGSVKTNFGHLEAAAGIAGLLKVVLSLQHREIPPHLHFHSPNPHVPWQNLPVKVPTTRMPWPIIDGRRIGGVSSFGFSGTNAHAVLEEAPPELFRSNEASPEPRRTPHLLTLSAKTPQALHDLVSRYQEYWAIHAAESFDDICYTSSAARTHFSQRLSVVADSAESGRRCLADWLSGTRCPSLFEGRRTKAPKIGFFFGGHVLELDGVARQLYDGQAHFRRVLEQADEIGRGHSDQALCEILYQRDGADRSSTGTIGLRQAAFCAIQFALVEMWRGFGIEPNVLVGHGIGQFAAACAAGVFSFKASLELLLGWSRLVKTPDWKTQIESLASRIDYSKPRITLLSPVTGRRVNDEVCHPDYWIQCLNELQGEVPNKPFEKHPCDVVLGIGLSEPVIERVRDSMPLAANLNLPTLSSDASDWRVVIEDVAALYAVGASLNWKSLYDDRPRSRVVLPTYPFQRKRYWVDGAQPMPSDRHVLTVSPVEHQRRSSEQHLDRETLLRATKEDRRKLLETYVTQQLAEILKRSEDLIDNHEPLQSLGMDSLMAIDLKYRIENDLAVNLEIQSANADYSLGNLIDHVLAEVDRSPSGLHTPNISLLRNSEGGAVASLLVGHEQGGRAPLFFLHPGGIDISTYVGLVQNLPLDQPLYVLQPHGLYENYFGDDEAARQTTIGQAAAFCGAELLRLRMEGPYFLAGWSLGALVAYEMARRLKSTSRAVPILLLIDVMCGPARDGSTLPAWFADLLEARTGCILNYSFDELRKLEPEKQLENIWAKAIAVEAVHASMPLSEFQFLFNRFKDALAVSGRRAKDYKLDRELCADRIVFLNSAELAKPERRAFESVFDWTAGTNDAVEIHSVPGNHYTMLFEPAVKGLAATIQRCLYQIEDPKHVGSLSSTRVVDKSLA
jgi:acyl transferase domain-containing protein/thioesterase domain-containing protein